MVHAPKTQQSQNYIARMERCQGRDARPQTTFMKTL